MRQQLITAVLALSLLCGCAGYNHTMFMTKSNAGLDFDAKPPTVEITISRKEAVIAPSFEGGQTPPVMASFKPHSGVGGGFANFFVGVNQTFAGGDAAVAMSKLYSSPTAPVSDKDAGKFDSAIHLTQAPDYQNCFQKIPGPGKTRPLIFGTDTTLGLKAAWSGVGGQIPDTVKLGFNRKEFAWAPLTMTPGAGQKGQNVRMPSFLATIESQMGVKTNHEVGVEALQYFATGDAAVYLAMQRDVRAAMLARLDPNEEKFKHKFDKDAQNVFGDLLFAVGRILDDLKAKDPTAKDLRTKLDQLQGINIPDKIRNEEIPDYSFDNADPNNLVLQKNTNGEFTFRSRKLSDVQAYFSFLQTSETKLALALDSLAQGKKITLVDAGTNKGPITAAMQANLATDYANLDQLLGQLKKELASNDDIITAFKYVNGKISPR